jgi:hypothetical protein
VDAEAVAAQSRVGSRVCRWVAQYLPAALALPRSVGFVGG